MQMRVMKLIRNKIVIQKRMILPAIAAFAAAIALGSAAQISAAPAANWVKIFTATPKGSFVMGNVNAPTKLVEYASYTCSHCATFEAIDAPKIKTQLVANGKTSFEIRNLVRDPYDVTLALLARCGGKGKFFGNHATFMANQDPILNRTDQVSAATLQKLKQQDLTGFALGAYREMKLFDFISKRGITDAQAKKCLSDKIALQKILDMTDEAGTKYGVKGTPTILVNDKVAENAHDFAGIKKYLPLNLI